MKRNQQTYAISNQWSRQVWDHETKELGCVQEDKMTRYDKAADRPRKSVSRKWPGIQLGRIQMGWGTCLGSQRRMEEEKLEILLLKKTFKGFYCYKKENDAIIGR